MTVSYASSTITVTGGASSGTSISGTATTLTDTGKSWTTNAYAGRLVVLFSGTGLGSGKAAIGLISSNTATVLTVDGFWSIDAVNRTKSSYTPGASVGYVIAHTLQDIKDANDSGGWGVVSKQDTTQFALSGATKIVVGNGSTTTFLGTMLEDLDFSASVTLPCITLKSAGYFCSGSPKYESRGSSIHDQNTLDDWHDDKSVLYQESGSYAFLFSGTRLLCNGPHQSLSALSGSYCSILGGTGNKVISTRCAQIRIKTSALYCDGLAHMDGIDGSVSRSSFTMAAAVPSLSNMLSRGMYLGLSGSTTVSPSAYTLGGFVSLDNTYDSIFWGSHTFNLVNPNWSASLLAQNHAAALGAFNVKYTYDLALKASGAALSGARLWVKDVFGTEVVNALSDGTGAVAQQQIQTTKYEKTVALGTAYSTTNYGPFTFRVRKYGYKYQEDESQVSAAVTTEKSVLTNVFVVANEATASAYTGVAISGGGKTITLSGSRTLQEIYDYSQAWGSGSSNIQYEESLATVDGSNLTLYAGWMLSTSGAYLSFGGKRLSGGTLKLTSTGTYTPKVGVITIEFNAAGTYILSGIDATGNITLTNTSGGAVTVELPSGVSYTNSGPSITVNTPSLYQSVTITGLTAGSRVQIYDTTSSTQLANSTYATPGANVVWSSTTALTWTDPVAAASNRAIRVRIAYVNGTSAKDFIEANIGTCGTSSVNAAVSYLASQQDDTTYNSNAVDGSAVAGVIFTDSTVDKMNINISAGTVSLASLYAAWCYYASTETGITTDIDYIAGIDPANYVYSNLKWKNTTSPSVPLKITGGYAWDAVSLDPTDLIDTTGGTIFLAPPHVVSKVVTVTGSNVITGDVADVLAAIPSANANASAVWAHNLP